MNEEKQINEMTEIVKPFVSGCACEEESGSCELTDCRNCNARNLVNKLREADYRKQSEVVIAVIDEFKQIARQFVLDRDLYLVVFKNALDYAEAELKKKYTEKNNEIHN